jgi:endonuclease/exonuclease/phosphatase family metal-dependent hydrolase
MARARNLLLVFALLACAACATARNYPDPAGPRFAGQYAGGALPRALRVVSFNVKYGRNVGGAAELIASDLRLKDADVLALQEMDETGVDCIARSLRMNYVYYPAAVHPEDNRNFGNAILSPWPIEADAKLVLPHLARLRKMQRIAVAATVRVWGELPVRVLSVHLETPVGLGSQDKHDQARAIVDAASGYPRVIVAGDFNGRGVVADVFPAAGFLWLTRGVGHTISRFSWDHLLSRGLRPVGCGSVGRAPNSLKASDHLPVWADLVPE